jgi:hypothetical protein
MHAINNLKTQHNVTTNAVNDSANYPRFLRDNSPVTSRNETNAADGTSLNKQKMTAHQE